LRCGFIQGGADVKHTTPRLIFLPGSSSVMAEGLEMSFETSDLFDALLTLFASYYA